MDERTVQWVLLKEWRYLQDCLGFPLLHRYGENIRTEQGILDFVVLTRSSDHPLLIVELETGIDTRGKLDFVKTQLRNYKDVRFPDCPSTLALLYAADETPDRYKSEVKEFCKDAGVIERFYLLQQVQELYQRLIKELVKTTGIPLGPTAAMERCYLRWMNRLIKPFVDDVKTRLPRERFVDPSRDVFKSPTVYNVHKRLCEDFELIEEIRESDELALTSYGERFAEAMVPGILVGYAQTPPLSTEQKRILLEILTNGVIRPCKANVYYLLRFIHLTEGEWIPKSTRQSLKEAE